MYHVRYIWQNPYSFSRTEGKRTRGVLDVDGRIMWRQSKNLVHWLGSSASEYRPGTSSCLHGNGPAGSWGIKVQGGAFIDHLISLKEKAGGVNILSVPSIEPGSLLCADVKNLLCTEQWKCSASSGRCCVCWYALARRGHCSGTWGVLRQVSSKRSFPSKKFITMDPSCLVRLSWCNGWHCCHISRSHRFEFLPEVFVRFFISIRNNSTELGTLISIGISRIYRSLSCSNSRYFHPDLSLQRLDQISPFVWQLADLWAGVSHRLQLYVTVTAALLF